MIFAHREIKNLKGTMNQLDSRQEKISKIFGNSASRTMEMSVKVEDIRSKLETVSEMANNVEDVKRLITELEDESPNNVDKIEEKTRMLDESISAKLDLLGQSIKESINCLETSINIDVESAVKSSMGAKFIQMMSEMREILGVVADTGGASAVGQTSFGGSSAAPSFEGLGQTSQAGGGGLARANKPTGKLSLSCHTSCHTSCHHRFWSSCVWTGCCPSRRQLRG